MSALTTLTPDMDDVAIQDAVANTSARFFELVPGAVYGPVTRPILMPAGGVPVYGRGATLKARGEGKWWWQDPGDLIQHLRFDGGGDGGTLAHFGTGTRGRGAKMVLEDVEFTGGRKPTPDRPAVPIVIIDGIQNWEVRNGRVLNGGGQGAAILGGCKTGWWWGFHSSYCADFGLLIDSSETPEGEREQRTTNIQILSGLTEGCPYGIVVRDAADVVIENVKANSSVAGVFLSRSALRTKGRLNGPAGVKVRNFGGENPGIVSDHSTTVSDQGGVKVPWALASGSTILRPGMVGW